ncbi:MAG TPA: hypothetical protein VKS01_03795 [Bryobacteraceae bacterium]|nr:hypothetical protein [Bryobacteraceae bacterium]
MRTRLTLALAMLAAAGVAAQDSGAGFSVPITLGGGAMYTDRLQAEGDASPYTAGFRAVLYPTLRLDDHWFGYAAIQLREAPYFYYDAFDSSHDFYTEVIQAFVGYSARRGKNALVIKAGRLASAVGAFPMRYDDTDNPLLDQPLSYTTALPVRGDQVPWGVYSLAGSLYGANAYAAAANAPGLTPVTLYSIPGIEADVSLGGRVDGRVQITSGSPANPQSITQFAHASQWAAGAGYTIRQGFRVGMSAFRGPYLGDNAAASLPMGTGIRSFPSTGIGVDAQWASGRWSLNGEWQRFQFDSPGFAQQPSLQSGYAEAKSIVTPRIYLAARAGWLATGSVADSSGATATEFAPALASLEAGGGYWLGRNELIKASYEWLHIEGSPGARANVLGAQFVYRFNSLGWSFR